MKYARNVMMDISTQEHLPSMSALNVRASPSSDMMAGPHLQPPRSPFASNGMEIAGVLSSSALGQSPSNPSKIEFDVPSKKNPGAKAIQ